jgi:hypothetical protein
VPTYQCRSRKRDGRVDRQEPEQDPSAADALDGLADLNEPLVVPRLPHNVMPLSGRGGARATLDRK